MSYLIDPFKIEANIQLEHTETTKKAEIFIQHFKPQEPKSEQPAFVLIHGGGSQSTDWIKTPDGREGWAALLAKKGFHVYVVDRVGHGKSPYDVEVLGEKNPPMPAAMLASLFIPPAEGEGSHPAAMLHTQWPGDQKLQDHAFQNLLSLQSAIPQDTETAQRLDQAALVELVNQIGHVIVISHSAGAPAGFLISDACAEKVIAHFACEPLGPALLGAPHMPLAWGVANAPLQYSPPVSHPKEIKFSVDTSGPVPLALQQHPVRKLTELAKVPVFLVTAEASVFRWFAGHTEAFLRQAGCAVETINLWEKNIRGNSHGLIFEKNHEEVLDQLLSYL